MSTYEDWDRKMGLPLRLMGASLEHSSRETAALDRVRRYLADEYKAGACLVLSGPTGVGKSWAAAAFFRHLGGVAKRFVYFPGLCGAWLDPERRTEWLERAKTSPFIVFDDFGTEYAKEGGLVDAFLDEMIWYREAESLPCLFTTNLTSEQLRKRLPDRLVDRIRGDWGRVFECPGESLRT